MYTHAPRSSAYLIPYGAQEMRGPIAPVGAARAQVGGHGAAHAHAPVAAQHAPRAPLQRALRAAAAALHLVAHVLYRTDAFIIIGLYL